MALGFFEVAIGILWGLSIELLRRYFLYRLDDIEGRLNNKIAQEAQSLQVSIEDSIDDLQHAMGAVADIDPLEAIQVQVAGMKASIMQSVLEMGVGWIGQKFQKNLGIFETVSPEAQSDAPAPLLDESSPN